MVHWYKNGAYTLTRNDTYSVSYSYNAMIGRQSKCREADLIWNSIMMPRHRFIVWLAYQERLLTKARLLRLNLPIEDDKCGLCDADQLESQQHLFAECDWVKEVKQALQGWSGLPLLNFTVEKLLRWYKSRRWKQFHKEVATAIWGASIYHTWKAWNQKQFQNLFVSRAVVIGQIQREI